MRRAPEAGAFQHLYRLIEIDHAPSCREIE